MPRSLRIEFPGAWYHVINRGLGKRTIFSSDKDRSHFLKLLGDVSEKFRIEIHAYSLMNNHYHLLLHTPEGKLSRAMRHINGVYTQIYNKLHVTDGPLFRGRYKALIVDSDEYLLELVRYIHLNPVEAGLCSSPTTHKWTSHGAYMDDAKRPKWLVTEEVLSRFGMKKKKAIAKMNQFVSRGVSKQFKKVLKEQPWMIGGRGFQEWIYQNYGDPQIRAKDENVKTRVVSVSPKVKQILDKVAFAFNTNITEIRQCQNGKKNDARSMAIYLTRQLTGITHGELARWMNAQNEHAMAKSQQRFVSRLERDKKLRSLTAEIKNHILSAVMT